MDCWRLFSDGCFPPRSFVGGQASAFLSGADGCTDFAREVAVVVTSPAVLAGDVTVGVA